MVVEKLVVGRLNTNCYVIYETPALAAAVIDPGSEAENILGLINSRGLDVKNIILTHGHFDHMLAAAQLREATGARVIIHAEDAEMLENAEKSMYMSIMSEPFRICTPDVRLYGGEKTLLGKAEFEFIHTPGHTRGSMCIRVYNLLFTGDTLFEGTCGRVDFPGGNERDMKASLAKLSRLPGDYIVYPGHEDTTTLGFERSNNPYMKGLGVYL